MRYGDSVFRTVRWHMYQYPEIKSAIFRARGDAKRKLKFVDGIRPRGIPSDPTATEAIQNLTPLKSVRTPRGIVPRPEAWIECIDSVRYNLDRDDGDLFKAIFVDGKRTESVCNKFLISRATLFKRKDRLVSLVAIAAAKIGLVEL